ncbi:oligoribonuclease [Aquiluna borgnonia]|uniref:Oligoribonuclease n=1 Tax=Aquiluna borgnonia TaxID=2499157 RepID=A0A7D4Q605_9MICO|nr:oligoribonuclease [Aquiluna borgnonia]QKJ25102.1 oligoribonuclease [Aquiluna borgnonia]
MSDHIVWVDCEMTGLDIAVDEICEVGVVVTDGDLNPVDSGLQLVIKPSDAAMANMGEFVTQMHTDSGLLAEIPNGISITQAQEQVLEYLKQFVPEERSAPLAGNSIGTDRMFLNRQMPLVDKHLHYRNIDVSSIKELTRRWYPRVYFQLPKKSGNHRALADILESIQELRYYRKAILVPEPGPDSETAKGIANSLGADRI